MRLYPALSSTALTDSPKSSPFQFLMLSSHLLLCLPLLLVSFTYPCRIVLTKIIICKSENLEIWKLGLRFFTTEWRSCLPIASLILFRTSSLVELSLFVVFRSLRYHRISRAWILPSRKQVRVTNTPYTPLLYSKTGVYRGIHFYCYFCSRT